MRPPSSLHHPRNRLNMPKLLFRRLSIILHRQNRLNTLLTRSIIRFLHNQNEFNCKNWHFSHPSWIPTNPIRRSIKTRFKLILIRTIRIRQKLRKSTLHRPRIIHRPILLLLLSKTTTKLLNHPKRLLDQFRGSRQKNIPHFHQPIKKKLNTPLQTNFLRFPEKWNFHLVNDAKQTEALHL